MDQNLLIAIDGPAASGKGTLARRLADYYHLPHLDTGLTYRAVAHRMIEHGLSLDDAEQAADAARKVDLGNLDKGALAAHAVADAASRVAVFPQVRRVLVEKQRAFANQPGGAVLDGRDIGTVICPEAEAKLFVTASDEARAARRAAELAAPDVAAVMADLCARDARDSSRDVAPLRAADDALLLDTTDLTIDAAVAEAVAFVKRRFDPDGE